MFENPLREPKPIEINGRKFIISKFKVMEGREIVTQYFTSAAPKIGNYKENEAIAYKMLKYAAVETANGPLRLETAELIDSHCGNWETEFALERALMGYNCSFFQDGQASNFLKELVQNLILLISQTLTDSSAPLSPKGTPPSTS